MFLYMSEAILAAGPPALGLCAAGILGAAVGAMVAIVVQQSRARHLRQIGRNLNQISSDLQADLRQLQLDDTASQLGAAWNQLVNEIAAARQELETVHLRQQARETLNQFETKWFTQLLNQVPYGLVTVAEDWLITFANAAAERMLGSPEGGLKGRRLTDFLAKDLSTLPPGRGIRIDQVVEFHASPRQIRLMAVTANDGADRSETALVLQDVTEQREQESERSQFLYHLAHELRTPLTNIRAYAETLREGVLQDPETLRECCNAIVGETQRLSRRVEDILILSQVKAGAARQR